MTDTPKTPQQLAVERAFFAAKRTFDLAVRQEAEAIDAAKKHEEAVHRCMLATRIADASLKFCAEQYASAFKCSQPGYSPPQDT